MIEKNGMDHITKVVNDDHEPMGGKRDETIVPSIAFQMGPREAQATTISSGMVSRTHNESVHYGLLIGCIMVNVCFRGIAAEVETIIAPDMMLDQGLSLSKTSLDIGALGGMGLLVYMMMRPLSRLYGDFSLLIGGLLVTAVGTVMLSFPRLEALPLWVFIFALSLIWSVGYPIGQTATLSVFSKVLANLPPGGLLGIFSASGSIARMTLAAVAGYLDDRYSASSPFLVGFFMSITSLCLVFFYRKKFIAALQ